MKKYYYLLFLFGNFSIVGQQIKIDTIIDLGMYKSYFNYTLKEPLYVSYNLYKGGGVCSRAKFIFKKCGVNTASDEDYAGNSFDKGHLANAEDFANNCVNDEKTFCYYNCLPQTIKLNRGIWKKWETTLRDQSQSQALIIVAGGIFKNKTIGSNNIGVPDQCYKIVMDAKTKKTLYCLLFPNDDSGTVTKTTLPKLKKMLGYKLIL